MTQTSTPRPLDFPALDGRTVTEAHAAICRDRGHATHRVNGLDTGVCPRCGEVTLCGREVVVKGASYVYGTVQSTYTYGPGDVALDIMLRSGRVIGDVDARDVEVID